MADGQAHRAPTCWTAGRPSIRRARLWPCRPLCHQQSLIRRYETKDHKYMAVGAIEPEFYSYGICNCVR